MEKLDYSPTAPERRLPKWFKITGGLTLFALSLGVAAIGLIILFLWLCIWIITKIAPAL